MLPLMPIVKKSLPASVQLGALAFCGRACLPQPDRGEEAPAGSRDTQQHRELRICATEDSRAGQLTLLYLPMSGLVMPATDRAGKSVAPEVASLWSDRIASQSAHRCRRITISFAAG